MHLNGPRSVLVAAVLIAGALIAPAFLPRYELRPIRDGAAYVRIDRWTGRAEMTATQAPAAWLTFATPETASKTPAGESRATGYARELGPLAVAVILGIVLWQGPTAIARLRRGRTRRHTPSA